MNRPSWHTTHISQAELMADRSLCMKLKVGAVLVRDNRTISQGYNGTGPGCVNCVDYWTEYYEVHETEHKTFEDFIQSDDFKLLHKHWSPHNELHAEQNCILWAAREGISTKAAVLYTIYSPCINCAKVIHMAGIKEVYYRHIYGSDQDGIRYLNDKKILCNQL